MKVISLETAGSYPDEEICSQEHDLDLIIHITFHCYYYVGNIA